VSQAQTSPTDREIRHALSPPRPHRTPRYAGFNTGQRARLDALLRAHSPSYGLHYPGLPSLCWRTRSRPPFMKGPCVSVRKSSLRPPKYSPLRASCHAGKTRRNWPGARGPTTCLVPPLAPHLPADHPGPCPVAHLIPPPRCKSYFSPRDRDIRIEPPLRGGSVPDLAGQAGADERDLRLAVMAGQIGAYNWTPQESLGGMSPYETVNGRPPPRYEMSVYSDSSYPPRCSDATVIEARPREYGPKNRHPYLRSSEFRQCCVAAP
jgi:hypothetical protein